MKGGRTRKKNSYRAFKATFKENLGRPSPPCVVKERRGLAAEAVESATLALESINHVHGRDSLPLGVLRVSNSVTDHVLQEHLEHTARLLVDEPRDALDTAAPSQAADGRLGDALDVVAQHLAVALSAALAEPFAAFASTRHDCAPAAAAAAAAALKQRRPRRGFSRMRSDLVEDCSGKGAGLPSGSRRLPSFSSAQTCEQKISAFIARSACLVFIMIRVFFKALLCRDHLEEKAHSEKVTTFIVSLKLCSDLLFSNIILLDEYFYSIFQCGGGIDKSMAIFRAIEKLNT
ncbi:hypothetical protein IHE44_0012171 [Lamprotornis superbus]|uniref:Uncharacterized protein n=1 Tax=Lamprotornis superbus TaxID=245042 RepID=A0A835TVB7_9PASS|nr:hypothetical protein IHE44_0012171 [Lamprotornis superbus]